jgi:hypothetical protein
LLGRSKFAISAARLLARELGRANVPAAGRLEAVPVKGLAGRRGLGKVLGVVVRYGLWLSLVGTVLAFFLPAADRLGQTKAWLEIAVGVVLTIEGLLLVTNWHGSRWRLVSFMVARQQRRSNRPTGMIDALRWRLFGYALFAVGLAWLAVGVVYLGQGVTGL